VHKGEAAPSAAKAPRSELALQSGDPPLEIGREMASVPLPQRWLPPIVAGDAAATARCSAGAVELVVRRAVTHRVIDGDLIAGLYRPHRHDGDLAV